MSLRLKVIGAALFTFLLLFVAVIISGVIVLNSVAEQESIVTRRNIERVFGFLEEEVRRISIETADYAYWDEALAFTQGENATFAEKNFSEFAFSNINIDAVIITDREGSILFAQTAHDETASMLQPLIDYAQTAARSGRIGEGSLTDEISGLLALPDQIVFVATRAVTANPGDEVAWGGFMTLVKQVDAELLTMLSNNLQFRISAFPLDAALPADVREVQRLLTSDHPVEIRRPNQDVIFGYARIQDIKQQFAGVLQIEAPRDLYGQTFYAFRLGGTILIGSAIMLSIVTYLALDFTLISRVTRLRNELCLIRSNGDLTIPVTVNASDEITALQRDINSLLRQLHKSQIEVKEALEILSIAYLQAEEGTRLKTEFLATISHELRTPLSAILGYAEIMLYGIGVKPDPEVTRIGEVIHAQSEHLLSLIDNLLDLSRFDAGTMPIVDTPYRLRSMVDQISKNMRFMAEEKALVFDTDIDDRLPEIIIGDEKRTSQIIQNLLSNAFKFTDKGVVSLKVFQRGGNLVIAVADTGIGIADEALPVIFERFRQADSSATRKYGGAGLGLSVVQSLVMAMDGLIDVQTEVGKGSVFTVSLPLKVPESSPETPA